MSALDLDLSTCIGSQTPRLENFPTYFTTLGDDAIDLAAIAGIDLLPWQELLVRQSLGQKGQSTGEAFEDFHNWGRWKWSASSCCLIAPRQNGKNVVVYVRQLAGIHFLRERIMYSAHEFDTARDAHRELVSAISFNEDLEDEFVTPHKIGAAELSIRHKNGGFIHYVARGKNARRGRTRIDLMILDEAFALDNDMMGSLSPLQQASLNSQTWYTSSAGTEDSPVLTRIRDVGTKLSQNDSADHSTLLFAEWSCPEGSDPDDFENWIAANPSLGVQGIAPVEALREDRDEKMDVQQFAREHLGMWDDPAMNSVIPFDAWKAAVVPFGPEQGSQRVICVDVDPDRLWASICVAEKWPDGRHHVEVIESHAGTHWILGKAALLLASSNPPRACVVQGGAQAGSLSPELEQLGYKVHILGTADVGQATAQFYSDIVPPKPDDPLYELWTGAKCTHLDDPALLTGLGGAAKYKIGPAQLGHWGWLRKGTSIDITGIVGCSYANRVLTLEAVEETLNAPKKHRLIVDRSRYG